MNENKPEPGENQEESLQELADRWRRETGMHSNPSIIRRNDAYLKLVESGEAALPFIFDQLAEARRGLWWMPLEAITGIRLTDGVKPVEGAPGWIATDVPILKEACGLFTFSPPLNVSTRRSSPSPHRRAMSPGGSPGSAKE